MLARFKAMTAGRPYQWATKHGIPRHVIVSLLNGTYAPQLKTRMLIEEKTGINMHWLIHGEGKEWLPGRDPLDGCAPRDDASRGGQTTNDHLDATRESNALAANMSVDGHPSPLSDAGAAAGRVLTEEGYNFQPDLLESVVRGVEEFVRKHDLDPPPDKKAIAISLMYRFALMKGAAPSPKDIADFFKLAA